MGALNVKPDDLARIVNCPENAHVIVKVLRLVDWVSAATVGMGQINATWEVEPLCSMRVAGTVVPAGTVVWACDRCLRPLPGLPENDEAEVVHELPLDVYGEPAL